MLKVVLINPPSSAPNPVLPLGIACLAAVLKERGYSVRVIDAWAERLSADDVAIRAAEFKPGLVGITIMSPSYFSAARTIRAMAARTDAFLVAGGPHPSALPEESLVENPDLDAVVAGEGEIPLLEILRALESKEGDMSKIPGVAVRNAGGISFNRPVPLDDLDGLPFPARELFPLDRYHTHPPYGIKRPYMTLITSRGCPFHCSFCSKSVFKNRFRAMSPERVIEEIQHLIRVYGVKELHFYDDDFTIDMNRAHAISDLMIQKNIKILWSCTTRADLVDEALLRRMKRAGCRLIAFGVESADNRILKRIKKGYTLETIERAFKITKAAGIKTLAYFMAGLPGETPDTLKKTVDYSIALDPDFISWGITALYPGSPLFEEVKRHKADIFKICTSEGLQGHASGSPYGDGYAAIYEESLTRQELEQAVKAANRAFYLRPRYLARLALSIRSAHQLLHYLAEGLKVLKYIFKGLGSRTFPLY